MNKNIFNFLKTDDKTLSNAEIEYRTFFYDWFITILILLLVSIIILPPIVWNEENSKTNQSRKRMLDLAYALKC